MSTSFSSMSDSQLRAHYLALAKIVEAQSECVSYCSVESTNLRIIREILNQRTSEAAARALTATTPESSARRGPSVSPYLFPSPREKSGSMESRGVSSLMASTARIEGSAGISSPPKSTRETALSTLSTADDSQFAEALKAVNTKAVAVHPEHPSAGSEASGSLARRVGLSPSVAVAPPTPVSIGAGHSAFVHPLPGSGHMSPAHSVLSRAISSLTLDALTTDRSSVVSSVVPERPRRKSLIAQASASPRPPFLDGNIGEDLELEAATLRQQEEHLDAQWRRAQDLESERQRRESERYALPPGVNLLNPPADPSKDPLFTVYFRGSLAGRG
jgi:hypothetical protein